jgi:predicted nuclease with TOPRIM domain
MEQINKEIKQLDAEAEMHRKLMNEKLDRIYFLNQEKKELEAKLKYGEDVQFYDEYRNTFYPREKEELYKGYVIRVGYPITMGMSGHKSADRKIQKAKEEIDEMTS